MTEKKLSKAQTDLLQILKDNPEESIMTYWPSRDPGPKAFLRKRIFNVRLPTVERLYALGYLDRTEQARHRNEFTYTLSEKGRNYGS